MTVRVYRSTDSSAPTLSNNNGSFVTLLDKCLVSGYGSNAAAGWAIEFTGTNKRVYRAPSGSRMRLRVSDTGSGTEATGYARVRGFESMSDVDTGTGPFPTDAQVSGGLYCAYASGASRPWILVADEKRFWFNTQADGTTD